MADNSNPWNILMGYMGIPQPTTTPASAAADAPGSYSSLFPPNITGGKLLAIPVPPNSAQSGVGSGAADGSGLAPGTQLADNSSGGGRNPHACETAFNQCLSTAETLHDRGYVPESNNLYRGCLDTRGECYADDQIAQTPGLGFLSNRRETYFPPNKAVNGGGYVSHRTGLAPVYVPPSTNPLVGFPPKNR